MNRNRAVNVGLIIMVVFVVAAGAATIPVTGDLPLQTNTGFTTVLDQPGTFVGISAFVGTDTISISSGTVTAAGSGQLEIIDSDLTGDTVLDNIDVSSTTAEIDPSDKAQFDLNGGVTAFTFLSGFAEDDGNADLTYTSTSSYDLTVRGLTANTDYILETSSGVVLGVGDTDASGDMTITVDEVGTFTAELRTNDPPELTNLSPDGVTVTDPTQTLSVDVDDTSFCCASGDSVDVEFYDASDDSQIGTTQTITSTSTVTQSISLTTNGAFSWYVIAEDKYGASTQSPDQTFTLDEPQPVVTDISPADNTDLSEGPVTIEVTIEDANLGNGDSVDVQFKEGDGTNIGSVQTLTANGTASVTYSNLVGGANQWQAEISDSFGNSFTTDTFTFRIPNELTLRNVNDATEIIDDPSVDATVRFYEEQDDDVYPREPTNGVIDMQGLPVNEPFVVGIRDDSGTYVSRLTLIDTIFEQQSVYLINSSRDTAIVRFTIEDRTGQFAGEGTKIQIRRAINTTTSPSDQEEYVIVAGDVVGSQLQFETELQTDVRYRVRVANDAGETRQLGAFTARVDQVIGLTISGIDVGVDIPEDEPVITTAIDDSVANTTQLQFTYVDLAQETSEVNLEVLQAGNRSNVLDTATVTSPPLISTFQHTTTLTGAQADLKAVYSVEYVRNGETFDETAAYGLNQYPVNIPLSDDWRQIFSVGFLIVLAGVFSVANARIGAIMIPGVAAMLYAIGFIDGFATILGISLAMVLGIAFNLAFAGRGVLRS
jgi:hypothetical protein